MKNLINYLSKKSLSLENGSRLVRDRFEIGSAKSRKSIGSNLSRLCLASLICLCMLTVGVGNAWGQASSATVTDGGTYVVCAYSGSKYYALPNNTTAGTWNGTEVTVNGSGQVTTADAPTWTMKRDGTSARYYLTYKSGNNTYYLYKNGTSTSNKNIKGATGDKNYWTFTAGTGGNAGKYQVIAYNRGSNHTCLTYTSSKWQVSGTSGYSIILLELAPACSTKPTVGSSLTSVSATVNSITATVPISAIGGCNITENGLVYSTSVATPTVGAANCTKVTVTACGSTAANKEVTISDLTCGTTYYIRGYATNGAGTSYTNAKTQATSDCPLFTITYNAGSGTCGTASWTQPSYGASTTLPTATAPATCTGWSFAGWCTSSAGSADENSTSPGTILTGSYTPTGNVTLYAIYKRTASGGTTTYTLVDDAADFEDGTYVVAGLASSTYYFMDGNVSAGAGLGVETTGLAAASVSDGSFASTSLPSGAIEIDVEDDGEPDGDNHYYFISYTSGGDTYYLDDSGTKQSLTWTTNTNVYTYHPNFTQNAGTDGCVLLSGSGAKVSQNGSTKASFIRNYASSGSFYNDMYFFKKSSGTTYYMTSLVCCTDPGLAYGTGSVTKTYGASAFTNTLTNSHSVAVTYSSSDETVATVNGSGQVTILKAGSTTITASSAAQTVAAVSYCADEASYTLTVNKADISPTLTYDPAAVTVGSTLTSFTLSGNSGSGSVSYSSSNDAIATVNSSGVVEGVAPGTVTITATIAATTNYNGNTATSNTITVNAAACTGVNSLHTGNKDQGGWVTNQCFEDADWGAADDAIYVGAFPLTNECYVGWAGGNSYYGTYWAVGGIKTYDIPTGRTLGWNSGNYYQDYPGGALGTFHIYKNSTDENYYLRFKPSSYILRTGSDGTSWTSREMTVSATNSHYYETAELDLTSTLISEHAYVDLKTNGGDGHVWCNFSNDRTASGNVKVKSSVGDADGNFRGDNLKASDNGTHGKFRIDITKDVDNWKLAFVPMYRITYAAGTGALGSMDPSSYAEISTTIAAAANGFTAPTGKQFNGWSDGINSYAAGANVTMNSNVTLTAQWTDIDYTVTVSQSPDVSATTTGQTSSAHYNGTINLTTTVPDGYRFVNWTSSDVTITNPTSATTASFTMPAKNVTVTANFQQTHKVDWYVGGSAPANKIGDDGQTTVVDHGGKISNFPAHDPDGSACDKEFVGWTNTSSYVHGTSPLFNDVAGSPTINADANFYAVFAEVNSVSASLTKMTADDDLEVGDKIVIIAQDTRYGMYQASASSYVSYWTTTDMDGEPSLSEIEADDKKYLDVAAGGVTDTWKLGNATNGYLYNSSSTNLEFSTTNSSNLTLIKWTDDSFTLQAGQYISCRTDITGANANKWRGAGASCDPEEGTNCSGTEYYYLYKYVPGGTTATGHTINCADCGSSVTPTYTAAPAGGTVSVTKSAAAVASGSTVKTCTAVDLTVTITPASHYTLTGFTATGLTTGTATISPATNTVLPSTSAQTFTVTVSASATGTLNLTPTFTEDAHVAINWNVNGVNQSIAATEGLTWVYSGGDLTALPSEPSVPAGCSGTKVFAGWSAKHSDATEEDASYYDDLFTTVGGAPTGISSAKTFYAVFATSSANPLAGETMWAEDFSGFSADDTPNTSYGSAHTGTTVYNSGSVTYACTNGGTTTKIYAANLAGGTSPEILVSKSNGQFDVTGIPTGGQTELTLTYKCNKGTTAFEVSSATGTVTVGDASVDGSTYTRTITISQSPSATNSFALTFKQTTSENARLDDISLVVPGSGTMTDYVTLCAPSYTITYNKNTEDAVTNLPSPTSVLQSTGSGTLSSTVPERATYTFSGWAETTSGAVAYAAGGSITGVTGDKTIYAVWEKTAVEEIILNYTTLERYVGDPTETLEVESVVPSGADMSVAWSSDNSSVASVGPATGVVTFGVVGTATITATSAVTGTTNAVCYVTVRNKPTVTFVDQIHNLDEDKDGTALSTYNIQDVAGTAVTFPDLADQELGENCDGLHYKFVGWTDEDNNTDPEDHLITSYSLANDVNKTFYAVWADGVEGVSYTKLTTNSFKTSPAKYVIGIENSETTYYLYSCSNTDANNSWGYTSNAPATNAPIQFTLSGTAGALVATSTEATARYLTPLTAKNFQMSATSKTVQLNADGTIHNPSNDDWTLQGNSTDLRWYSSTDYNLAHFYEVTAGSTVSYRTSCCTNNVPAPTVVATNTAYTVTLTWAAVAGATGYEVSWNGGAFEAATSPCVKSGLTASTDYIYKVRATYDPLVKCGALVASGNVTTDDVYTVTYSGGTGTGSCSPSGSVAPASYEAGATVTLAPTNSYSMTSNTFAAWVVKDADDNDVPVSNNQFTMPAKNVTVTATWTPVQDKYYDRMHDGTDGSHGGVQDGEGKYYLVREGCNYTVPTLTDDDDGDTDCHTTHYKLLGWIAGSHLKSDGSIKDDEESYIFQGGTTKSATGATYYAVWAIMTE